MLRTLRQSRYIALSVLMAIVALGCIAAGTWQISRFEWKVHGNDALRANAHDAPAGVGAVLPLVGHGGTPASDRIEFRAVTATGRYDAHGQSLVRNRTIGDNTGFLVLTPLRTAGGTLLVVRGFLDQPAAGGAPALPAPPAGTVTITARAHGPESRNDQAAQLTQHQVESINPAEQQTRLGGALYDGYAELEAGQPGTRGLGALPPPDLSNPAGGALEPQHFAYVIQWYLFAILAVAAPFVMARAENREKPAGAAEAEIDAGEPRPRPARAAAGLPAPEPDPAQLRAAKLADRYGRTR